MAMPVTLRHFTVGDLDAFPDDGNLYELLDGVLFVTPAPLPAHEALLERLVRLLHDHLRPWPAVRVATRSEVVLPPDNKLEPDLQIYHAETVPRTWAEVSDRWLTVEVASRSTRVYDREYKRDAYLQMGVQEVWLVDRFAREVRVSRRTPTGERVCREELIWSPPAPVPSLSVDLVKLFEGLPEEW